MSAKYLANFPWESILRGIPLVPDIGYPKGLSPLEKTAGAW